MSQYFIVSLNCPVDWIGFVGATTAEELYWGIDRLGLDPHGVIFREVYEDDVALAVPVRCELDEVCIQEGMPELLASPSIALDPHTTGVFDLHDGLHELYGEMMQLVIDGERSDEWLAFVSMEEVEAHYESETLNQLMAERRKALDVEAKPKAKPVMCWWLPVEGVELDALVGVPVFVKVGQVVHPCAVELTKADCQGGMRWEVMAGDGEPLPLADVTAFMRLNPVR